MLIAGTALWNVAAALGPHQSPSERNWSGPLFALDVVPASGRFTALVWGSAISRGRGLLPGAPCSTSSPRSVYNLISDVVGGLHGIVVLDDEDALRVSV